MVLFFYNWLEIFLSFFKHVLSTNHMSDAFLGTGDIAINKS